MRRLENEDEEKFWEAWIKDDLIFCYRFGKIGSQGQTKIKKFATTAEAEAELEEKLQEKLGQGFSEGGAEEEEEEEEEAESEDEEEAEDEEEDEESDDDGEEEESEDEDDEDEAPKKKAAKAKSKPKAVAVVEEAKPSLPARFAGHTPLPEQITAAKNALEALHVALGGRSWKVARLARRARQALERVGGIDPHKHTALGNAFDALMEDVVGDKKKLPLDMAMGLLFEVDSKVFVRAAKQWRAKGNSSVAKDTIAVIAASAELSDAEVALHIAAALADRKLDAKSWKKRFAKVKPFLEETLKKSGSTVAKFCKTLESAADDNKLLHAHIEEIAR